MVLTVYMADDERVILRGLKKLIDWEALGLRLIGEAYRGDDLLQGIIKYSPDIVIADIAMPGMTGIDVLKEIKEHGKSTKVIFISAYREFTYAKDALSYGAVDYLIKPIDRKKLEQILLRTVAAIHETSAIENQFLRLKQYEVKYQRQAFIDYLEQLIEKRRLPKVPDIELALRGEGPNNICFSVMVIDLDQTAESSGSWHEGERKLIYFAVHNIVSELIPEGITAWAIPNQQYLCLVLKHSVEVDIHELSSLCLMNIKRYLKISVTIGISTPGSLEEVPASFQAAQTCVSFKYFLGIGKLISQTSLPTASPKEIGDRDKMEKELMKAILSNQDSLLQSLLDDWLELVLNQSWGNREYTNTLCVSLLTMVLRELAPLGLETETEELRLVQKLHECNTFEETSIILQQEIALLRLKAYQKPVPKDAVQIAQVKAYIEEHYWEEINLETMANRFYISPYYFSTFFKKNTGMNFKQFVTEIRMKNALQLLTQTDSMLYEIAERVGYHNARQFSELFKKHYGVLPNEFRKGIGQGDGDDQ
ncbi:response regulator transcription factor [Paenibacillus ferrarius]|uniref:response regulator transcription factor n=1 Tax=Paenibacillus ferrarius TaxID=1469647 RepID=UPI003D27A4EC